VRETGRDYALAARVGIGHSRFEMAAQRKLPSIQARDEQWREA